MCYRLLLLGYMPKRIRIVAKFLTEDFGLCIKSAHNLQVEEDGRFVNRTLNVVKEHQNSGWIGSQKHGESFMLTVSTWTRVQ